MTNSEIAGIRALVAKQAEDKGLWFVAETAAEAYVQQGLRRLHAMIESSTSSSTPIQTPSAPDSADSFARSAVEARTRLQDLGNLTLEMKAMGKITAGLAASVLDLIVLLEARIPASNTPSPLAPESISGAAQAAADTTRSPPARWGEAPEIAERKAFAPRWMVPDAS